jgi:tetratricopeptide (TPR) repeat protein
MNPDLRPDPYLKSEQLMQQGLQAYEQDDFNEAQQKFSAALVLYRSFDNDKGMALSQINLVETALAVSDFSKTQLYLKQLKQQSIANALDLQLQRKLTLLEVKLAFELQNYLAALAALQPLLAELDGQKTPDVAQLNLLAMQARLEVLISPLTQSKGLAKFTAALAQVSPPSPHYQMLLKRVLALAALKQGNYQTAKTLLTEALAYYKEQANRRSIASCLEDLASVELAQRHNSAAQGYLNRALLIWQWLKNEYKSNKINKQLAAIR